MQIGIVGKLAFSPHLILPQFSLFSGQNSANMNLLKNSMGICFSVQLIFWSEFCQHAYVEEFDGHLLLSSAYFLVRILLTCIC